MAPVSTPPPRMPSSLEEPVVHLIMPFLLSSTSLAGTNPGSTIIRARRLTFTAVGSPMPVRSTSSLTGVAATDSRVMYPAFLSLVMVALATPSRTPGSKSTATRLPRARLLWPRI